MSTSGASPSAPPAPPAAEGPIAPAPAAAPATATATAPSRAKQQKKSAFSCHNCRARKVRCGAERPSCQRCVKRGDKCVYKLAPTLSYTERLERRIRELEAALQDKQSGGGGRSGSEALLHSPPETMSTSTGPGGPPSDAPSGRSAGEPETPRLPPPPPPPPAPSQRPRRPRRRPSGPAVASAFPGLQRDEKGGITYHGATSFFRTVVEDHDDDVRGGGEPGGSSSSSSKRRRVRGDDALNDDDNDDDDDDRGHDDDYDDDDDDIDDGDDDDEEAADRRQRLVKNAWHQRALESANEIPQPFNYMLDLHWCWIQPLFNFVYRPAFTRDVQSKGPYYSHALLSAIMAHSTRWASRDPGIRAQLEASYEGGRVFGRQARALVFAELERGDDADAAANKSGAGWIPTIQTLLLLSAQECSAGHPTQAWVYSGLAFRLADHAGIFIDGRRWAGLLDDEDVEIRHRLFWSCYFWDKIISLYLGRRPMVHHAGVSPPGFMFDDSAENEIWVPHGVTFPAGRAYPRTAAHSTSCFIKMCELSVIFHEILVTIYDPLQPQPAAAVVAACARAQGAALAAWWDALPPFLALDAAALPAYAPPSHVVTLNCLYHTFTILLFRPALVRRGGGGRSGYGHGHGHGGGGTDGDGDDDEEPGRHLARCVDAAVAIAAIFDLFCRTFGENHCIASLSYSLYIATSIFLLQVQAVPSDERARRRLVFCVQYLERVQVINRVISSALKPIKEAMAKLDVDWAAPATPWAPAAPSPDLGDDGGPEPMAMTQDSNADAAATGAAAVHGPDDMFQALAALEPISASIQPLDLPPDAPP